MIYNQLNFDEKHYMKSRNTLILRIEKLFRGSLEYRKWLNRQFELYNLQCPFTGIDGYSSRKLLELHHHPFTLYELQEMAVSKYEKIIEDSDDGNSNFDEFNQEGIEYEFDTLNQISSFQIQKELQDIHLNGLVQFVPLQTTYHQQVHEIKDSYFQMDVEKYKIKDEWVFNLDRQQELLSYLRYSETQDKENTTGGNYL